jgi:hypothetical protein
MTTVSLELDPVSKITTATGRGRVIASDLLAALHAFYDNAPTMLALCDISDADLSSLPSDELSRIVQFTERRAEVRRGGKTAIAASRNLEYGMARMYEILAEAYAHPVTIRAFRTREEALQWLREEA